MPTKTIPVAATEVEGLCCTPLTEAALSEADAAALASVLAALSDPVRLRLLSLVASEGEVCSCVHGHQKVRTFGHENSALVAMRSPHLGHESVRTPR